ncbi:calcium-binding protein [Streptococcus pneumoniae]
MMNKGYLSLLKKIGLGFLLFVLFPFVVLLSPIGVWYFSKKKPDTLKRNISIGLSALALFSIYSTATNPNKYLTSTTQVADSSLVTTSPSSDKNEEKKEEEAKKAAEEEKKKAEEAKKAAEAKKKAEEAKKAEEEKKKAEEAKKAAEEEKKKAEEAKKAAEEKKRAEEAAKKAEEERLIAEGEAAVQNLEANQVPENIQGTQSTIDKLPDSPKKADLQHRVQAVQGAIAQREEQARQEQEAQVAAERAAQLAAQQEQRIVYVARNGNSNAYWYSLDNMPSNTRFDRVVQMSEAEAIANGKHPAKGHG